MIIPQGDQSDLEWYFGPGVSAFERSPSGAMLERQRILSVKPEPDLELQLARARRKREGRYDEPEPGDLTARPTAEVRESGRDEPEHHVLMRYGKASSRLARMSPADQAVLAAYFGDSAARWARSPGYIGRIGRLGPVMVMTAAGRRLVERDRRKSRGAKLDVTPTELVENAVAREELQPARDKSLIEQAIEEAQAAVDRAAEAWVGTAPERNGRSA